MRTPILMAAALAAASVTAASQEQASSLPPPNREWMVPIHTLPDDPAGGAYGQWASGPDYKVRFDDGFTFYPVLGESYPRNLPLCWRTWCITVGGKPILDHAEPAPTNAAPWRYEIRHAGVTEAYDVLAQGVEQTFVLHSRPAAAGDLVIRGQIATELVPVADAANNKDGITFADAGGRALVRYSRAIAFDAAGRRADVATCFQDGCIELRLAGSWLEEAIFPVTVDPLTSRVNISGAASDPIGQVSIARDPDNDQVAVGFTRAVSATDWDLFVRLRQDDLTSLALIYSDVNAAWSTRESSIAFVRGANRWLVAFHRDFVGGSCVVRVYFHDGNDLVLNNGTIGLPSTPAGFDDRYPVVGGATIGNDVRAFMVFQRDPAPNLSSVSRVFGRDIDAATFAIGPVVDLHGNVAGTDYDAEAPSITQDAGASGAWMVVWQEFNRTNLNDDWDVLLQRIHRDGSLGGAAVLGHGNTATRHKLFPNVAGAAGRFLVEYTLAPNQGSSAPFAGDEIAVQRFDWNELAPAPTLQSPQTLAAPGTSTLAASRHERAIAYDTNTLSHWAIAWRNTNGEAFVARCGFAGHVVEQATLLSNPLWRGYSTAVCYNADDYEFVIALGTDELGNPATATRLQYQAAQNTVYGLPCLGTIAAGNAGLRDNPYLGSEFFSLRLLGGALNAPTVLFASRGAAQVPIPGGCTLNLDPTVLIPFVVSVSDGSGNLRVELAIPDTLPATDLYWQFIQVDLGGITGTRGLRTELR